MAKSFIQCHLHTTNIKIKIKIRVPYAASANSRALQLQNVAIQIPEINEEWFHLNNHYLQMLPTEQSGLHYSLLLTSRSRQ